jgi:hypothetical protein
MPIAFDPNGDFTSILDGGEPLTLLRRGSSNQVAVPIAWRYSDHRREAEPSGGYVVETDVEWQFEWPADTTLPELGDRLRDASGACYTILAVHRLQAGTRLKCETRSMRIAHGLDCVVDIQQAVWDAGEITDWTTCRPAVHARVQPDEVTVNESADPVTSSATYRITLDDDLELDHNHRIVAGDGAVYRVLSYIGAGRIDQLPVAVARRE